MKTKNLPLLVLIASAMVQVLFCINVSVSVLILAMIQDQALVASKISKHYLIETKENSPGHKQVVGSFKILKIHISYLRSRSMQH